MLNIASTSCLSIYQSLGLSLGLTHVIYPNSKSGARFAIHKSGRLYKMRNIKQILNADSSKKVEYAES